MARGIYEIKVKECYFPALSAADALEMQVNSGIGALTEQDVNVSLVVSEEHTMKLFLLAKTMYDTEKFNYPEVEAAVSALARQLGYFTNSAEITSCITTWVERFDEMPIDELTNWLID